MSSALDVLNKFYNQEAFVQTSKNPFADSYDGNSGSNAVLDMLTTVESDFREASSAASAQEELQGQKYDEFMAKSKKDDARNAVLLDQSKNKHAKGKESLSDALADIESSEDALTGEKDYKRLQIDPKCVETGVSFEDRQAKRQAEIESLQDALKILSQVAP